MILGYHVIISMYGFWLPNDPRGSWSTFVRSWELFRFGKATKVFTTQSVAHAPHDRELRRQAKQALHYPPVRLTGRQALAVAHGFDQARRESGYVIHACAILPEHTHLVLGRDDRPITRIVGHLKGRATQHLKSEGLWAEDDRPVWGQGCWKRYIDEVSWMRNAIAYVADNPLKEGLKAQHWSFVAPFNSI